MQKMLGVDQPDFGHLFATMRLGDGDDCLLGELIQPRVEAEIGIILGKPLRGPGLTDLDVLAATEALVPTLEIVDSRILNWKITFVDTVADNGSSARFVVGKKRTPPLGIDTRTLGTVFEKNGELVGTGAGAAVLGANPLPRGGLARKHVGRRRVGTSCGRRDHAGCAVRHGAGRSRRRRQRQFRYPRHRFGPLRLTTLVPRGNTHICHSTSRSSVPATSGPT